MDTLSRDELLRYSRQVSLPEVGLEGQARLRRARVLCIGAGGLGAPVALYLAGAGVGTLALVDADRVDASNLQRQVLFGSDDVGELKTRAGARRLRALNPHVTVDEHPLHLSADNALALIAAYDVVVDGSDNFATRYLVNDAAVLCQRPLVHASVFRFEGQLSVFNADGGPCYRCVFPEAPPAALVPSCAEGGVLGMLPGLFGNLQALEAIKLLLGIGCPLSGRLLSYDALQANWREYPLQRDPQCRACGARADITRESFSAVHAAVHARACTDSDTPRLSPGELQRALAAPNPPRLLDVREAGEVALGTLPGALHIPLAELPRRLQALDSQASWVITCQRGPRSEQALALLHDAGFTSLALLAGGMEAWLQAGGDLTTEKSAPP
ncbi:molybdopterin-synthase adenylyltransferase MoeB [Parahaliea mediterranea]|uniref:molybdopterin-synthase adenylyltransferase MoeB n=1 Tax=Parahaliea mediterranea TaxID=651086 RepID=UPI000E2F33C4|nr:molybdopterin-synthase adenylyltransferase MoeB [Parahaliea mediterranea]